MPRDSARAPATLRLDNDKGRAEGFGGCNRFSGAFTRRGDSLSFGAMMATKMACAGPGMDTEMAYLEVLPWVRSYQVRDSTLTLLGTGGTLARFVRAPGR